MTSEPPPSSKAAEAASEASGEAANATPEGTLTPRSTPPRSHSSALSDLEGDHPIDDEPPPAYGDHYGFIDNDQEGLATRAAVTDDGRVNVRINQKTRGLSSLLVPALRSQINLLDEPSVSVPPSLAAEPGKRAAPLLNVVIHVVGSRGDVQPFVALGKVLINQHGHRVRLATHPVFKQFVEDNGLEFFSIGGDPSELMAFMVKNPGLMPGFDTLRRGDVGKRRKEIGEMIKRCWRSCIESGNGMDAGLTDTNVEEWQRSEDEIPSTRPFVADAIIANPPSFAHIHCAEKLGIPLHMMFTMPWSPTRAFPHPLANIQSTDADTNLTNYLSYALVEMMTWQGLGDVINRFRLKNLGLEEISATSAPAMLARLKVPWTYCWSPALIPKPVDWRPYISIAGFYFLSLAPNYEPEPDLAEFLASGPTPVYIGFGSIVVDDPNAMTKLIFKAVVKSGQRALVSKGWGGFGAEEIGIPDSVFMTGNVPHDWLFERVSCVVHHGGAGTTAAGIAAGKPTVVVPFFGDQPFWGAMVARAGAGPKPIPHKQLTSGNLAEAITEALKPETVDKARLLSEKMRHENGTEAGAGYFHQQLDVDKLRCTLSPTRAAAWRIKRTQIRLSAFAATVLVNHGLISFNELKLFRPREYDTEEGPYDPITGGTSALIGTMTSMTMGIADFPVETLKALKIHPGLEKMRSKSPLRSKPAEESPAPSTLSPEAAQKVKSRDSTPSGKRSERERTKSSDSVSLSSTLSRDTSNSLYRESSVTDETPATSTSAEPADHAPADNDKRSRTSQEKPSFNMETTFGTGKGIYRITTAGFKSPMDFTYQLARGFHNAPKLYGDTTVRPTEKITGLSSGLKAAGKEFGWGFADGIAGLFTQPYQGAKKEGTAGFFKGFGKGIGGIALKPSAAMWALPGYTFKGIYKEIQKKNGPSIDSYVISQRTAQGYEEVANATPEERQLIINHWQRLRWYIKKKKTLAEMQKELLHTITDEEHLGRITANSRFSPSPKMQPVSRTATDMSDASGVFSPADSVPPPVSDVELPMGKKYPKATRYEEEEAELEEAIRRSVQETSRGDPEEDAAIERAIRASIAELEVERSRGANDEELEQAMKATIEQANKGIPLGDDEDDEEAEDEELDRAIQESKELHEKSLEQDERAKREEEIIMRYMMRQSEAEEEMKKNAASS